MYVSEQIVQYAKENNGIVTAAALSKMRILRGNIKNLLMMVKLKELQEGYIFCRKYGRMSL